MFSASLCNNPVGAGCVYYLPIRLKGRLSVAPHGTRVRQGALGLMFFFFIECVFFAVCRYTYTSPIALVIFQTNRDKHMTINTITVSYNVIIT